MRYFSLLFSIYNKVYLHKYSYYIYKVYFFNTIKDHSNQLYG